jgi:uncharacterized protein YebE (UPF0316 family)
MNTDILITAGGIFVLRVIGNMITTLRLVLIVRGQKISSSLLAVIEALIFAVALGSVVSNLNDVWNLAAYSVGYAVGGYLGLVLEHRLVQRYVSVHVISPKMAHEIAVAVREAGFGATESWGEGAEGTVGSVTVVVGHQEVKTVARIVHDIDPGAFLMMEELRAISQGYFRRFIRHER